MDDSQHREVAGSVLMLDRALPDQLDLDGMYAPEHFDLLAQRSLEPVALELGRAQAEDQRAQLVERLAGQPL